MTDTKCKQPYVRGYCLDLERFLCGASAAAGCTLAPYGHGNLFVVGVSAWTFRRGRFGVNVSPWRFRCVRFGDVKMSCSETTHCVFQQRNIALCGNDTLSCVDTTYCPVWTAHIVLCGDHTLSCVGTTHCPVWKRHNVLCGNDTLPSVETIQCVLCGNDEREIKF